MHVNEQIIINVVVLNLDKTNLGQGRSSPNRHVLLPGGVYIDSHLDRERLDQGPASCNSTGIMLFTEFDRLPPG